MWRGAEAANTIGGYRSYLNVYPAGMFAAIARDRIAAFERASSPAAPPPSAPASAPPPVDVAVSSGPAAPTPTTVAFVPPATQGGAYPSPSGTGAPAQSSREITSPTTEAANANSFATAPPVVQPSAQSAPQQMLAAGLEAPATNAVPAANGVISRPSTQLTTDGRKISYVGLADSAPLPAMPPAIAFDGSAYPSCREDYQSAADAMAKIVAINNCMGSLDRFVDKTLNGFAKAMKAHQEDIARIYNDKVAGQMAYGAESQDKFYQAMLAEHAASNPDGVYFKDYDQAKTRYNGDRVYLQDRYCFWSGSCGGYPPQPGVAPPNH